MSNEVKEMKSLERDKNDKLKSLEVKVPKPNLKELRKNKQFMKTIYDQQYVDNGKNLTQVAQYLQELTDTLVSGKTIGNNFKAFGWELRAPRKKPVHKPAGDVGELDKSKLKTAREELLFLQKIEILYNLKNLQRKYGTVHAFVPNDVLEQIESIAYGGFGMEKIREHNAIVKDLEEKNSRLNEQVNKLKAKLKSFKNLVSGI